MMFVFCGIRSTMEEFDRVTFKFKCNSVNRLITIGIGQTQTKEE